MPKSAGESKSTAGPHRQLDDRDKIHRDDAGRNRYWGNRNAQIPKERHYDGIASYMRHFDSSDSHSEREMRHTGDGDRDAGRSTGKTRDEVSATLHGMYRIWCAHPGYLLNPAWQTEQ